MERGDAVAEDVGTSEGHVCLAEEIVLFAGGGAPHVAGEQHHAEMQLAVLYSPRYFSAIDPPMPTPMAP